MSTSKGSSLRSGLGISFLHDHKGAVAIIVALTLPFLVLVIGGAADYMRILAMRSRLQSAADGAVLATFMRYMQDPRQSVDQLKPYFRKVLRSSLQEKFDRQAKILSIRLELDEKEQVLTSHVRAKLRTTFIRLAGIDDMPITVVSEARAGIGRTEVALVLDTTKSMEGARLAELKQAAKKFLDDIYARVPKKANAFRVAIVPFAEYVNVGMDKRNAPWIHVDEDGTYTGRATFCHYECPNPQQIPNCHWEGNEDGGQVQVCDGTRPYCDPNDPQSYRVCREQDHTLVVRWEGCVGSRDYPYNLKDSDYALHKVPGVMNYPRNPLQPADDYLGWQPYPVNHCPSEPITPLTSLVNKLDVLKERIDRLKAEGFTYIPIGLAWGWRVLSNNGPDDPYHEGADADTVKLGNVRKIIILMTDGMNRIAPNRDIPGYAYRDHSWRCKESENRCDASRYADDLLLKLCSNIKATNPDTKRPNAEIVTVTFDVKDDHIKELLRQCSSLGSFDAKSGELTMVFGDIARKIAELHLSR